MVVYVHAAIVKTGEQPGLSGMKVYSLDPIRSIELLTLHHIIHYYISLR